MRSNFSPALVQQATPHSGGANPRSSPGIENKKRSGRVIGLDLIRAAAILMVLVVHGPGLPSFLLPLSRFGWTGVDLFFVLSGYLIGGLLLHEVAKSSTINFRRFYARRLFKIWPSYYAFLTVWWLIYYRHDLRTMLPSFFHLQNYLINVAAPTWSLAVEEHFYLGLPLLIILLLRKNRDDLERNLMIVWFFLFGLCLILRLFYSYTNWTSVVAESNVVASQLLSWSHFRIDSLMAGVFLAVLTRLKLSERREQKLRRLSLLVLIAGAITSIPLFLQDFSAKWYILVFYPSLMQLTYMALLWLAKDLTLKEGSVFGDVFVAGFTFIAKISYNVYLWHWLVMSLMMHPRLQSIPGCGNFYVYMAASLLLGWLMTLMLERPFLMLRDRVVP